MIQAHINEKRGVPLWASVGVPLLGVPVMVALLSLTAPAQPAPAGDVETGTRTEQVDAQTVEQTVEPGAHCRVAGPQRG